MRREAELAEGGIKEATPLGVVALIEIKSDGDMIANVDGLQNSGGSALWGIDIVGVVRRRCHGGGGGCGS